MVLGGLWHGASWTFVIWGFLHGVGLAVVHFLRTVAPTGIFRLPKWLGILVTFHFVSMLWVFFRAPTLEQAKQMLVAPFAGTWSGAEAYFSANAVALLLLAIFFGLHGVDDHRLVRLGLRRIRPEIVLPLIVLLWALAMTLSHGSSSKFIYFEF
jgi:alginate O-acetyltransferase complex protein AlgI